MEIMEIKDKGKCRIDFDKVQSIDDIKAILKGLDLTVDYEAASDEVKRLLNDRGVIDG